MAEEEQGVEKGSENILSKAVEGFPDGVGDGVGFWGGGGEHFVRAAEISSAVSVVQSAKRQRIKGSGREGCGGKK